MRRITKGMKLTEREKAIRRTSRELNEYMECLAHDRRCGSYGPMHSTHIEVVNELIAELRRLNNITDEEYLEDKEA